MRFSTTGLFLSLAAVCCSAFEQRHRSLSQDPLVNYEPRTQITDNAAIDLDQEMIAERAGFGQFAQALHVYEEGGHSRSYAELTLISPGSNKSFKKGTNVIGKTEKEGDVFAELMEDVSWGNIGNANRTIRVLYAVSDIQSQHVDCMVGGLYSFQGAYRDGCLAPTGKIEIAALDQSPSINEFSYAYDTRQDNDNGRTIQKFSTDAHNTYLDCDDKTDCYIDDYAKFVGYYGDTDYGDKWVQAAAKGNHTNFKTGRGNANFEIMEGNRGKGRAEAMMHGTVFLNLWMHVVYKMEKAIQLCNTPCTDSTTGNCEEDAVHAWDTALAYYAGSIEGQDGSGDGYLLYALADSRSREFKTAGYLSDKRSGTSYVNLEVVHLFSAGQSTLVATGESRKCELVASMKEDIVNLMKVPLIQTVFRYAWKRRYETDNNDEKHEAKGASYAAALLPYVHACKASHANLLYNTMKVGSKADDINFTRLKENLEELYDCLGVTCAQVGGLYKDDEYLGGADPCFDKNPIVDRTPEEEKVEPVVVKEDKVNVGVVLGVTLAVLMVIAILGLGYLHMTGGRRAKSLDDLEQNNIAAVTAVSEVDMS